MSANPGDPALVRLNYFNGQRLAATDYRSEQGYHLGMRRVLNRSLYSSGIVTGLEVEPDKSDVHRVIVRDGLAFDHLGREIFVAADVSVYVSGVPSPAPGVLVGNLLVVSYREARSAPVSNSCVVGAPYRAGGRQLAWGAPTRVVAEATFEVLDAWPAADSGKVVLAQIELSPTCAVVRTNPGVRKYAVPVKAGKTRVLSLVGDSDVAPECPKVLHFHIADGLPERAQLYLRGGVISSLWYSELALHTHDVDIVVDGNGWEVNLDHTHSTEGSVTESAGVHRHGYWKEQTKEEGGGFKVAGGTASDSNSLHVTPENPNNALFDGGSHFHDVTLTLGPADPLTRTITPGFGSSSIADTGMGPGVRGKKAYTYFEELKVKLDGTVVTEKILEQLPSLAQLGVGGSPTPDSEPFVTEGTGAIDMLLLGVDLLPGAHTLEFIVPNQGGGGKLFYELYLD